MSNSKEEKQTALDNLKSAAIFTLNQISIAESNYKNLNRDDLILMCGVLLKRSRELVESDLRMAEVLNAELKK